MKMKTNFIVGILFLVTASTLAQKTITCKRETLDGHQVCLFSGVTVGQNEAVSINTDPANVDVNQITYVKFVDSSIYSIPREIFTKFPELTWFWADSSNIQEIKSNTFANMKKAERIDLDDNKAITFWPVDLFKGES
jgi:hypothetical protein